jgi:hypothetical protein
MAEAKCLSFGMENGKTHEMKPVAKIAEPNSSSWRPAWFLKLVIWFRIKRLDYELKSSKRFQQYCKRIRCFNLAELEECGQKQIQWNIVQLRREIEKL